MKHGDEVEAQVSTNEALYDFAAESASFAHYSHSTAERESSDLGRADIGLHAWHGNNVKYFLIWGL